MAEKMGPRERKNLQKRKGATSGRKASPTSKGKQSLLDKWTVVGKSGKRRPNWKKIFTWGGIAAAILMIGIIILFSIWIMQAPDLDPTKLKDPVASKIYDMDGKLYTEVGAQSREYVKYKDIPEDVRDALLATEDNRFFKHRGIDVIRLGGAIIGNITGGFGSQGASTLTQQLVKLSFLDLDKTAKRKVQEMYLAWHLESKFTKEEIFEMYFNKVNMSEGAYGIGTGAKVYFNKELKDLTLPEYAFLVGIPQNPSRHNPYSNPELANRRKNIVLLLMNNAGYISEREMEKAKAQEVADLVIEPKLSKKYKRQYSAIVDQVIKEVHAQEGLDIYADGLEIYTTIDADAQDLMEKILDSNQYVQYPNDEIQSGVTLLDTSSGEVRAIGGGRNRKVARGFNYATDLKSRQPGSAIKPILDYAPAIEYLNWSTAEILDDSPYKYPGTNQSVRNADGSFSGKQSMRYMLAKSKNIPAIKALSKVGVKKAHAFSKGLGITLDQEIHLSAAIGGVSRGASPYEMAGAYAAFGNDGVYNKPHTIRKIVTMDAETIHVAPKSKRAMKSSTAYMITDMLKDVPVSGTGQRGKVAGLPMAAKTGTTNYTDDEKKEWSIPSGGAPDSWYIGYTTQYTASVWVGYENRKEYLDSNSRTLAARIYKALMTEMSKGKKTPDFKMPDTVSKKPVIKGSNPIELGTSLTPKSKVSYELFVKGHLPKKTNTKYDVKVSFSNLAAAYDEAKNQINLSWKFTDTSKLTKKKPSFEITYTVDGGKKQTLTTTTKLTAVLKKAKRGSTYEFTIAATVDGIQAATKTTKIEIPVEPEIPDPIVPTIPETDKPKDEDTVLEDEDLVTTPPEETLEKETTEDDVTNNPD